MKTRIEDMSGIRRRIPRNLLSALDDIGSLVAAAALFGLILVFGWWLDQGKADPDEIAKEGSCVRNLVGSSEGVVTIGKLKEFKALCVQREAATGAIREPRP